MLTVHPASAQISRSQAAIHLLRFTINDHARSTCRSPNEFSISATLFDEDRTISDVPNRSFVHLFQKSFETTKTIAPKDTVEIHPIDERG
jgi:hypothetical protein